KKTEYDSFSRLKSYLLPLFNKLVANLLNFYPIKRHFSCFQNQAISKNFGHVRTKFGRKLLI
ncbi:MAG TPA: hypothetical protein DEQ42_10715, partial [Shigella sp.]|nr:hypothetical protein [Shigella sp.]